MGGAVAVIGSIAVVGLGVAIAIYATIIYRQSKSLSDTVGADPTVPVDLLCGMRIGWMAASWPGGQFHLDTVGVAFDCSGRVVRAHWSEVVAVDLVKPLLAPLGWGVRFKMSASPTVVLLGMPRSIASRIVERCRASGTVAGSQPHYVLV
jgi:hypothetical protein